MLSEGQLEWIYDPKLIHEIANMFTIQNCLITYSSRDEFPDKAIVETEKIYNTKYSISPLSNKLIQVSLMNSFLWDLATLTESQLLHEI